MRNKLFIPFVLKDRLYNLPVDMKDCSQLEQRSSKTEIQAKWYERYNKQSES